MNKSSESTADREIVISRDFDAPRELVWQAMTDPKHVSQWWGPDGFTDTIETMDFRVGGVWKHTLHGPDGTNYPNKSIFREIVTHERVVFTHGGGREEGDAPGATFTASWTFEALAPRRTRLTLRMVFPTAEKRDQVVRQYGAIEGGKQTLGKLAAYLEGRDIPLIVERTYSAPSDKVWRAITDKDAMKEWYFDMPDFKPELGCEFRFVVEHEGNTYDHRCKVTEVVPGKRLAYTWRYEGQPGNSLVTWELTSEGDKTRLRLTHEGLGTFPKLPAYGRKNFMRGWTSLLGEELKKFVEKA